MAKVRIYHNPRCSKSRQTLALLEEGGHEVEVVLYLDDPPAPADLDRMLTALGREPLTLIRTKEARFAELGLKRDDERPRAEWLRLMHENPVLIERPLVTSGDAVALGRPPESVLEIL